MANVFDEFSDHCRAKHRIIGGVASLVWILIMAEFS